MDAHQLFIERLPNRPFVTEDPSYGLKIRAAEKAITFKHIQPNPPVYLYWLLFDVDKSNAVNLWHWLNLPQPTYIVVNKLNGHAHYYYGLKTPVITSLAAKNAPIRYAAAVQNALTVKLGADPGYVGLIAKNPLNPEWYVIFNPTLYELGDLAEYLDLSKKIPKKCMGGIGRNCELFDTVRAWAYKNVLAFKRNRCSFDTWQCSVIDQTEKLNTFQTPLLFSEVKAIGRSIAKWTWRNFSIKEYSAIQSRRGKLGGRPRTTTKDGAPWVELGMSRATYYRKIKNTKSIEA